jgi:arsenate reductase-like glutaredoxin family protein
MSSLSFKFDPTKKEHVEWLKAAGDSFKKSMREKNDFMKVVNENPISDEKINPQDWAQLHFVLAMKYTDAVFDGTAHIPK